MFTTSKSASQANAANEVIDDVDLIPGQPEYHPLEIARADAAVGKHWLTILVNPEIAAGMRDDFVLQRIEAHETIGVKIGW